MQTAKQNEEETKPVGKGGNVRGRGGVEREGDGDGAEIQLLLRRQRVDSRVCAVDEVGEGASWRGGGACAGVSLGGVLPCCTAAVRALQNGRKEKKKGRG